MKRKEMKKIYPTLLFLVAGLFVLVTIPGLARLIAEDGFRTYAGFEGTRLYFNPTASTGYEYLIVPAILLVYGLWCLAWGFGRRSNQIGG
ncbi:MAG: hypothetical protein V3W51_00050 [Candidatus Brocadiales bacterium]